MQKRARQQASQAESAAGPSGSSDGAIRTRLGQGGSGGMLSPPTDVQGELEQHLARQARSRPPPSPPPPPLHHLLPPVPAPPLRLPRARALTHLPHRRRTDPTDTSQEMNLKVQMELQTKLHRQLLVQRQLQHQLEHTFSSPAELQGIEAARWQATLALKNNLRERLTKHVVMQQEMLHHLDALVSSEVSKAPPADGQTPAGAPPAPPPGGAPPATTPQLTQTQRPAAPPDAATTVKTEDGGAPPPPMAPAGSAVAEAQPAGSGAG